MSPIFAKMSDAIWIHLTIRRQTDGRTDHEGSPRSRDPDFLGVYGIQGLTIPRAPLPLFRPDALWVRSQNECDRDAIPERSVIHPTCCPGPLRASRALAPARVGRRVLELEIAMGFRTILVPVEQHDLMTRHCRPRSVARG